ETLQLGDGALTLALSLAQIALRSAGALLRDDPRIVGGAQLVLERVQLGGDAARVRLDAAEVRLEVGELTLDREDAGRGPFGAAADHQRTANHVAVERDERRARALFRAL